LKILNNQHKINVQNFIREKNHAIEPNNRRNRPGLGFSFDLFLIDLVSKPAETGHPQELSVDEMNIRIENREIKEISIKQSRAEVTGDNVKMFFVVISNNAAREALLGSIKKHNKNNTGASIRYNEEPVSTNWGWTVLINSLPAGLFFLMWRNISGNRL
jgi:ATP-dependent Zn protease